MTEYMRKSSAGGVSKHWLAMRPAVSRPTQYILLVAHGGAGPSVFWPMIQCLPEDCAVFGLCLPGRDRRAFEDPGWTPDQTAADAGGEILEILKSADADETPVIVVGQCMGAWLGLLILIHCGPEFQRQCERLVVLSQKPLHAPRTTHANADSEELWKRLERRGLVPAQVAKDPEMREMLEPVVRADERAISLFPTSVPAVACPIEAVVGERDPGLERMVPAEWSRYTPRLRVSYLPGGHLVAQDSPEECANVVVSGDPDARSV